MNCEGGYDYFEKEWMIMNVNGMYYENLWDVEKRKRNEKRR